MCVCVGQCTSIHVHILKVTITTLFLRALLEAQKIFGLDFDMEEFAQFGEDKTEYLDDEEEEEEVNM